MVAVVFKGWNKKISARKPQHLSANRAAYATPEMFDEWFRKTNKLFDDMDEDDFQHRLWNCDESGFCTAVASKKILAKRGEKKVHEKGKNFGHEG